MSRPIGSSAKRRTNTLQRAFGSLITELRVKQDSSQVEVAEKLGYSVQYFGAIERGQQNPTLEVMKNVANHYGVRLGPLVVEAEALAEQSAPSKRRGRS